MPVSLFTAPLEQITADDVIAFLDKQAEEGPNLDYKVAEQKQHGVPDSIIQEVVALANTYGGLIIVGVGVDKQTNRPTTRDGVIPLAKSGLEEQVTSFCYSGIVPPVVPDIRVCPFKTTDGSDRAFVVLRVQPSPAVHTTRENHVLVRAGSECRNADLMALRFLFDRQQQREQIIDQTRTHAWAGHLATRKRFEDFEGGPWKPGHHRIYVELVPLDAGTDLLSFESDLSDSSSLERHIYNKVASLLRSESSMMSSDVAELHLQRGLSILGRFEAKTLHDAHVPISAWYFDRSGSISVDISARGCGYYDENPENSHSGDTVAFFLLLTIVQIATLTCEVLRTNGYNGRVAARAWATPDLGQILPATQDLEHFGETTFSLLDPKKERSEKLASMVNRVTRTWLKRTLKIPDWIGSHPAEFINE